MKKLVEKQRGQKVDYKEIILQTLFAGAVVSIAVMAPNAVKMFGYLKKKNKYKTSHTIREKTVQLIKTNFIQKTKLGLELTEKGQAQLLRSSSFQFKRPKRWDGQWTIVSFDLPIAKNNIRDAVRFYLKRVGFTQLQKSVWVFPYDCPELIYLIKTEWKLTDELVYIRAKYVSREKKLKEYFDL